jgi:carbonic anhydrase
VKQAHDELEHIKDPIQRERRTIELHVMQQARNLMKTSIVQIAQKNTVSHLCMLGFTISKQDLLTILT